MQGSLVIRRDSSKSVVQIKPSWGKTTLSAVFDS